ncbi:MAG: hypothetical protein ACTTIC_04915 [Helicobacteraceae bacterium]
MKRLILLVFVLVSGLFAEMIDETKTDFYFINGMWNTRQKATKNMEALQKRINEKIIMGNKKLQKRYGEVQLAYNWHRGYVEDLLEAIYQMQKSGQFSSTEDTFNAVKILLRFGSKTTPVGLYAKAIKLIIQYGITKNHIGMYETSNVVEMLNNQIIKSFKLSHRVLIVSHSQGNLFANSLHDFMPPTEYKNYLANVQVGTPGKSPSARFSSVTNLSGDPIVHMPGSTDAPTIEGSWHSFIDAYLDNEEALTHIMNNIKNFLVVLNGMPSQWQTKEFQNPGTKNYRLVLEHTFDTQMEDIHGVFPFKPSEYLYPVQDSTGNMQYVKASYDGERILDRDFDDWQDKKSYQMYKLEGTDPSEFIEIRPVYIYVARGGVGIESVRFYMSNGKITVPIQNTSGFSYHDGATGYPAQGYDRYKDSKWFNTPYSGEFYDMILAVLPFEKESGMWCNNPYNGDCRSNWRWSNFPTYYTITYNKHLEDLYKQTFFDILKLPRSVRAQNNTDKNVQTTQNIQEAQDFYNAQDTNASFYE